MITKPCDCGGTFPCPHDLDLSSAKPTQTDFRYWSLTLREIIPIIKQLDRHGDGNRDPILEEIAVFLDGLS